MAASKHLQERIEREYKNPEAQLAAAPRQVMLVGPQRVELAGPVVDAGGAPDLDLFVARFRVLSADVVCLTKCGDLVSYPAAVLQAALPLFNSRPDPMGQLSPVPVKVQHERSPRCTAGQVLLSEWVDPRGQIPAGIESNLEFDRLLDPVVFRGVKRGILRAASVNLLALWAPSHPEMDWREFILRYGTMVDGRTVCEVAEEIVELAEISIVDDGGDSTARRVQSTPEESFPWRERLAALLQAGEELADEQLVEQVGTRLGEAGQLGAERARAAEGEQLDVAQAIARAGSLQADRVPRAELEAARADLQLARVELAAVQRQHELDRALAQGRISGAELPHLEQQYQGDLPGLQAYLATRPEGGTIPVGRVAAPLAGDGPPQDQPAPSLTARQQATVELARKMKVDEAGALEALRQMKQ